MHVPAEILAAFDGDIDDAYGYIQWAKTWRGDDESEEAAIIAYKVWTRGRYRAQPCGHCGMTARCVCGRHELEDAYNT
jgi:hypothetical protein